MFNLLKSKSEKNKKEAVYAVRSSFENIINASNYKPTTFLNTVQPEPQTKKHTTVTSASVNTNANTNNSFFEAPKDFSESFVMNSLSENSNSNIPEDSTEDVATVTNIDTSADIEAPEENNTSIANEIVEEIISNIDEAPQEETSNDNVTPEELPEENLDLEIEQTIEEIKEEISDNDTVEEINHTENTDVDFVQEADEINNNSFLGATFITVDDTLEDSEEYSENTDSAPQEETEEHLEEEVADECEEIEEIKETENIESETSEIEEPEPEEIQDETIETENAEESTYDISEEAETLPEEEASIVEDIVNTLIDDEVTEEDDDDVEEYEEESNQIQDNNVLLISEEDRKVYLPFTANEIQEYLHNYPDKYIDEYDVIRNVFILPLSYFSTFFYTTRFREAYALYKDREGYPTVSALLNAFKIMSIKNLHPAIIAACKNEKMLKDYLHHLEIGDLENFKYFEINFRINPMA